MKCPKCGSEYKIGGTDVNGNAVCKACQLKELKDLGFLNDKNIPQTTSSNKIIIETEPTTAEMQEWLLSNGYKLFYSIDSNYGIYNSKILKNGKVLSRLGETIYIVTRLVYEWARKEVTE